MRVRLAGPDDLAPLVRIGRALSKQAKIEHLVADDIEETVAMLLSLDVVRIYLAEADHAVVGGLGVSIQPFLWNMALTEMGGLFFWTYPDAPTVTALVLLRRLMADAEAENIDIATLATTLLLDGSDKLGSVYERLGFRRLQETYIKEFS